MLAAVAANMKIGFELAIKQHLLAAWAFVPEIFRHPLPGDDRADLRRHKIGEPAHRRLVAGRRCLVEAPSLSRSVDAGAGWARTRSLIQPRTDERAIGGLDRRAGVGLCACR